MTFSTALGLACVLAAVILALVEMFRPYRYLLPIAVALLGIGVFLGAPAIMRF